MIDATLTVDNRKYSIETVGHYEKCRVRYDGSHYYATRLRPDQVRFGQRASGIEGYTWLRQMLLDGIDNDEITLDSRRNVYKFFADKLEREYCYSRNKDLQELVKKVVYNYFTAQKARRARFISKACMNNFNFFATFTKDDQKIETFEEFEYKLKNTLKYYKQAYGWSYMGAFEVSPNGRLHAHLLISIPNNQFGGEMKMRTRFSHGKMVKGFEHEHFLDRFGMNLFEPIERITATNIPDYILKYITKTTDTIYYARGTKEYVDGIVDFNSDVVAVSQPSYVHKPCAEKKEDKNNVYFYTAQYVLCDTLFDSGDFKEVNFNDFYTQMNSFMLSRAGLREQSSFLEALSC